MFVIPRNIFQCFHRHQVSPCSNFSTFTALSQLLKKRLTKKKKLTIDQHAQSDFPVKL